jgi:hypothetical protein
MKNQVLFNLGVQLKKTTLPLSANAPLPCRVATVTRWARTEFYRIASMAAAGRTREQ